MKTYAKLSLYYDKNCPLCAAYTRFFVKYKWISPKTPFAYQDAIAQGGPLPFDETIAVNKIALFDHDEQKIYYGVDSLAKILSVKMPFVSRLLKVKLLKAVAEQLYNFISFNRKIIKPYVCSNKTDCAPAKRWLYRIAFIILTAVLVNVSVNAYFQTYFSRFYIGQGNYFDLMLFSAQILFQAGIAYLLKEKDIYNYLGHLSYTGLIGAISLFAFHLFFLLLRNLGLQVEFLSYVAYGMVFMQMLYIHYNRVNLLGFNKHLTYSWIIFRLLIYPLAFRI